MPLCACFIQPFAKRNYLGLLAIHIEKTYVDNEYARALMSVSALLTEPNQMKVPFTPTPDTYSHLMGQRMSPVCALSRAL